ncbi:MAG: hypothetical protein FJX76_01130 [Armatimonadetes bacterium]|nr:hypothetical protein [Armatimonadota bacterium]
MREPFSNVVPTRGNAVFWIASLLAVLALVAAYAVVTVGLQHQARTLERPNMRVDLLTVDDYVLGIARNLARDGPGVRLEPEQARRLLVRWETVVRELKGLPAGAPSALDVFRATLTPRQARAIHLADWRRAPHVVDADRDLAALLALLRKRARENS